MLVKGPGGSDRLPMSLILRIRSKPQPAPLRRIFGYRNRPVSFAASLVLHGGIVAILLLNPMQDTTGKGALYRQIIQPEERRIVFYDFRKKLPEVKAAKKIGNFPRPRGRQLSRDAMIAESPNPKSDRQMIWQPVPKIELPHDLPLPNLIARAITAPPPPPAGNPAPKPAPRKAFVLPSPAPAARPAPAPLLDAPAPDARSKAALTPDVLAVLKLKKTFVLPPTEPQPARSASSGALLDAPAPGLSSSAAGTGRSALPAGVGTQTPGIAPPSNLPAGPGAATGNANADLAIAGLHATGELKGSLPNGTRSGRFSRAPELGDPASGEGGGSAALSVPGLSIGGEKNTPVSRPPAASANRRAILYSETVHSISTDTLSVPLRPSSRTIPVAIDDRFGGRSVYTMVVPIENFPDYGGDWILWFAEREQKPGDGPSMRAPLPLRKLEPLSALLAGGRVERRLQIAAVIRQDGRMDRISLLRRATPAVEQAVIQDLQSWEFKPATRGGMPVDVDVVIEIPFNLTAEVASTGSK